MGRRSRIAIAALAICVPLMGCQRSESQPKLAEPAAGWHRKDASGADEYVHVVPVKLGALDLTSSVSSNIMLAKILYVSGSRNPERIYHLDMHLPNYLYEVPDDFGYPMWKITKGTTDDDLAHPLSSGFFHNCGDDHGNASLEVGFKPCPGGSHAPKTSRAMNIASFAPFAFLSRGVAAVRTLILATAAEKPFDSPDDPAWVACTNGCCTLNQY